MPASDSRTSVSVSRESATATTSTPAAARSLAATMPSSPDVTTTAWPPGAMRNWLVSRRAAPPSMMPGRSLLPNTRGCSIEPVASTSSAARKRCIVLPWNTGTSSPS